MVVVPFLVSVVSFTGTVGFSATPLINSLSFGTIVYFSVTPFITVDVFI